MTLVKDFEAKNGRTGMNAKVTMETFLSAQEMVMDAYQRLRDRIAKLEEAEARPLAYRGVYQRALAYNKHAVVTHAGSAWVALKDGADGTPGASDAWQLLVKAGKDAR